MEPLGLISLRSKLEKGDFYPISETNIPFKWRCLAVWSDKLKKYQGNLPKQPLSNRLQGRAFRRPHGVHADERKAHFLEYNSTVLPFKSGEINGPDVHP